MDLESLRDLVIVICGILVIITTLVLLIVALLIFGKVRAGLNSIKATVDKIQRITSVVNPIQRARGAIEIISRLIKRKKGEADGQ